MGDILGARLAVRPAVFPAAVAAGQANAQTIDALDSNNAHWEDGVLLVQVGEITGTPDSTTVTAKIQQSDDNSTWSDAPVAALDGQKAIGGANQHRTVRFNRNALKRYLQAQVTVAFTGGTSPKAVVAAAWLFGGASHEPTY